MQCTVLIARWFVVLAVWLMAVGNAHAHGVHQWVADKELRDPVSGAMCCGPTDCHVVDGGSVQEVSGGWFIKEDGEEGGETIPYGRGLPFSPDGEFHRCGYMHRGLAGGYVYQTRCFITPIPSM